MMRVPVWQRANPPSIAHAPYVRPLLFLAVVTSLLVLLAGLLSGPGKTPVILGAECAGFIAPTDLSLSVLTRGSLRFYWYSAEIKHAGNSWCGLPPFPEDPAYVPVVIISSIGQESPRLDIIVSQQVDLRLKEDNQQPILELSHQRGGSIRISTSLENPKLEWENLGRGQPKCQPLDLKHQITTNGIPMNVTLSSIPPPKPDVSAKAVIPLAGSGHDFGPERLTFVGRWQAVGCRSVTLVRQGLDGQLGDPTSNVSQLEVEWTHLESTKISTAKDPPRFVIHANGTARDIHEDGRQMLPSRFEELAGRSTQRKGVLGVIGAIIILTAGILLKRALDVLAQLLLPDPRR